MNRAIQEIRGMDSRELQGKLAELRQEQFDLHFHGAAEQVAKTARHRQIRRTIARIMMVLGERAPGAAEKPQRGEQR
jgi:large subunit ribosomal protein L29